MRAEAIESALERVIGSKTFSRAVRLRRFLQHVVQEEIAGNGEWLKEYAVGVAVFDRGADFDPRIDTIVRVEAIKLRERLETYYESEGATEPVRISLPKGSYRPVIRVCDDQPGPILADAEAVYWQARALVLKFTPDTYWRALCLLRRGVERWPQSARLHALLAEAAAGATCSDIGFIAPEDGLPLTRSAALRALALDPDCGEAHMFASLAESRFVDASAAVAAARRALALSPGNANLHHWGAAILLCDGKAGEALLHIRQASRLQPEALVHRTMMAMVLFAAGRSDDAMGHLLDVLQFEPLDYSANLWLSRVLCTVGRYDEARGAAARAGAAGGDSRALAALGCVEACAGNAEAADEVASKLRQAAQTHYVPRSGIAGIEIAQGRLDRASVEIGIAFR